MLAAATVALAFTSTAFAQTPKVVAKGETLRIQIYPSAVPQLALKVAVEKGFCKAHGLNCELVTIPSGPTGLQALAAGSLEFSNSSNDLNMQAASQGNDVQVVVGTFYSNPYSIAVRKDVPLPNLSKGYPAVMQDLKGLKIGVTGRGAATEIQARALLRGAGLDPETAVTFVAVGSPGTAYPSMMAKQIDAYIAFEPFVSLCKVEKTCTIAVNMGEGEGPKELAALNKGFFGFVARRDYIEKNPVPIQAFIQAMQDAAAWIRNEGNRAEFTAIAKSFLSLRDVKNPEAVLKSIVEGAAPKYDARIDREMMKSLSTFLIDNKLIKKPVDPASFVFAKAP